MLKVGITGSKHDELNVELHQIRHFLRNELESLLIGQAADDSDQRHVRLDRKTEFLLQSLFVLFLAGKIFDGKIIRNCRIFFRIVRFIINPVQNSRQLETAHSQNVVKTAAEFFRLNLCRIRRADGIDAIGIKDACFHKVESCRHHSDRRSSRTIPT